MTDLDQLLAGVVAQARAVSTAKPVTIVFANASYLRILANWLLHAQRAGAVNVLVLALDNQVLAYAESRGVAAAEVGSMSSRQSLWRLRVAVFAALLEAGISFVHSDVDAVWLAPPFPLLDKLAGDLVFSQGTTWPHDVVATQGFVICCGLFVARAGPAATSFFAEVAAQLRDTPDDQAVINRLLVERGVDWRGGGVVTARTWKERHFKTFSSPLLGKAGDLAVTLIPHHLVTRLPERVAGTIIAHPLGVSDEAETRLRSLGVWALD